MTGKSRNQPAPQAPAGILYHMLNSSLGIEFDRYVLEDPEFSARIPKNAQVVLQLEGETGFNRWARGLARKQRERGQSVVLVKVRGLRRMPSRLIEPIIARFGREQI